MESSTRSEETVSEAPARLTSRQRRIEEQRQRIEAARRQQRRKRAIWGSGIMAALAVVIGLTILLVRPPAGNVAAQGRQMANEGQGHVDPGTPIRYQSRPPTSGQHYPSTSGYGVFEREIEPGFWVHTLEHGAVVVLYRPDLCDAACVGDLRAVYATAPRSRTFNNVKMAVIPYRDMDHKVAVVAWNWVDEMDEVDRDRIIAFYREHVDRGPEQVP